MANRREFLKGASLLTLGALFSNCAKAEAAPKGGGPLGLQIYSLGPELAANGVAEGLKRVKESGYSYIELAGYRDGKIGQVTMAEFKQMADDAGIEAGMRIDAVGGVALRDIIDWRWEADGEVAELDVYVPDPDDNTGKVGAAIQSQGGLNATMDPDDDF